MILNIMTLNHGQTSANRTNCERSSLGKRWERVKGTPVDIALPAASLFVSRISVMISNKVFVCNFFQFAAKLRSAQNFMRKIEAELKELIRDYHRMKNKRKRKLAQQVSSEFGDTMSL